MAAFCGEVEEYETCWTALTGSGPFEKEATDACDHVEEGSVKMSTCGVYGVD